VLFAERTPEAAGRPTPPHRVLFPGRPTPIIFVPAFGFFGSGFGCDPFFGWSFGQGFGCNGFGYGLGYGYGGYYGAGYGYNFNPGYDTSYSVGASSSDSSSDASTDEYGSYSAASPSLQNSNAAPNDGDAGTSVTAAPNGTAASAPPPTTIYMKDGTSYEVMSYWLDAGKLHYITNYGGETSIEMSQVDLQRTVDENAERGGSFTLRPSPAADAAPAPQQ
jgi:hypothetical protein